MNNDESTFPAGYVVLQTNNKSAPVYYPVAWFLTGTDARNWVKRNGTDDNGMHYVPSKEYQPAAVAQ
jgi:hypothetical protein